MSYSCRYCTNSSCWNDKILGLQMLPNSILQYFESVNGHTILESGSSTHSMEFLLQRSKTAERTDIMKFLRNTALLCLRVFPRNYKIEEAILIAEEKALNSEQSSTKPAQALAKQLLKSDRQVLMIKNGIFWLRRCCVVSHSVEEFMSAVLLQIIGIAQVV